MRPFIGVPEVRIPAAIPSFPARVVDGRLVRGEAAVRVERLSNGVTVYRAGGAA